MKQNSLCEGNTNMDLEGKLGFKWIDLAFFVVETTIIWDSITQVVCCLTFRHRASCILGQAFHYSPENAFYIFNQQIYFIV